LITHPAKAAQLFLAQVCLALMDVAALAVLKQVAVVAVVAAVLAAIPVKAVQAIVVLRQVVVAAAGAQGM